MYFWNISTWDDGNEVLVVHVFMRIQSLIFYHITFSGKRKQESTTHKVKVTSFGRAAFSYSAIQQPFDISLPLVIGRTTLGN